MIQLENTAELLAKLIRALSGQNLPKTKQQDIQYLSLEKAMSRLLPPPPNNANNENNNNNNNSSSQLLSEFTKIQTSHLRPLAKMVVEKFLEGAHLFVNVFEYESEIDPPVKTELETSMEKIQKIKKLREKLVWMNATTLLLDLFHLPTSILRIKNGGLSSSLFALFQPDIEQSINSQGVVVCALNTLIPPAIRGDQWPPYMRILHKLRVQLFIQTQHQQQQQQFQRRSSSFANRDTDQSVYTERIPVGEENIELPDSEPVVPTSSSPTSAIATIDYDNNNNTNDTTDIEMIMDDTTPFVERENRPNDGILVITPKENGPLRGLQNIDQISCYCNAILQCLAHDQQLIAALNLSTKGKDNTHTTTPTKFKTTAGKSRSVGQLFKRALSQLHNTKPGPYNPKELSLNILSNVIASSGLRPDRPQVLYLSIISPHCSFC